MIFRESRTIPGVGSAAKAALQGRSPTRDRDVLGLVGHIWIEIIDYDNLFYTPKRTRRVLRRIEHAARNTAAAPLLRRPSLE